MILFLDSVSAANTIYVNGSSGNDSNSGTSWQQAKATITNGTNTVNSGGTVYVANGTYKENITLNKSLDLIGQSKSNTIIDGSRNSTVITINPGMIVGISNFTIQKGFATYGGGIYNKGTLTLNNCTITQNTGPQYDGYGGGIYNTGNLTVKNSAITQNIIYYYGGGLYNNGNCTINGSTFTNTAVVQGGAIYNPGNMIVTNSIFTGNYVSVGQGAAIDNKGSLNVSNTIFTSNNAVLQGGAIFNELGGSVIITNDTFTNNIANREGGAIDNYGNLTVTNSTFTGNNVSVVGGAINNAGTLNVTGSAFTSNIVSIGGGGAIYNSGTAEAHFNTFAGNTDYDVMTENTLNAQNNWWCTNIDPVTAGKIYGSVIVNPWIVLSINASPNLIGTGETSTLSVNLNFNSNNENILTVYGKSVPPVNVIFSCDNLGSLNPINSTIRNGLNGTTIFTAGNTPGFSTVNATVSMQKINTTVRIMDRNNIYVATNGNDNTGNGSPNYPLQTLVKAIAEVQATGTIHLASGEYKGTENRNIIIDKDLTLIGQNQTNTIINPENFGNIFNIASGKNVKIQNLTLKNGFNYGNGGAINNNGNLTVENCTFTHNYAEKGGAIYNNGNCNIIGNIFTTNTAHNEGGAIDNKSNLTITDSTFTSNNSWNSGGAISNSRILTVRGSIFTSNLANLIGGVIYNSGNCTAISNIFIANTGNGGVLFNDLAGNSTINNSSLTNNTAGMGQGGAIYNNNGTVILHYNSITGNIANSGSAIYNAIGTVDAANNWWGYNADPKTIPNTIIGNINNVITIPWLTSPGASERPNDHEKPNNGPNEEPKTPIEGSEDLFGPVNVAAENIPMKDTGLPLAYLILAVFLVLAGLIQPKRK